jgi:hypothetical protein
MELRPLSRHDIELAPLPEVITFHDLIAMAAQVLAGDILADIAQLALGRSFIHLLLVI